MADNIFDLSGKVALITGGNGGIGLGMATGLARSGADVVIWGRNAEKNERVREELSQYGTKVLVQRVDVSDERPIVEHFAMHSEQSAGLISSQPMPVMGRTCRSAN
jgi:NAD(P)-dependent dehydrogenase (short-subunit alcohol dehydrogenase family)